ncbi:MAG: thioredoxin family protein [Candidatus Hodarchaeales archaeon]|jgi:hypothetical protein
MLDRITEEFFQTGKSYENFILDGTPDEQKRLQVYFDKTEINYKPEDFHIDLEYPVNILVAATTWCWDSQTNVPFLVRIAEHSPNVNLKIFNKDKFPFIIDRINNGEKVPQALIFSKDFYYIDRWVEKTKLAYKLYAEIYDEFNWDKEKKSEFIKEYRKRFLKHRKEIGKALIQEIRYILERTDSIQASTARFH